MNMWLTKKILVPVDFSGSSRRACEVGVELAETFRVPLTLMHVVPDASVSYSRAILGSVAEKVVRLSPVPVLTVRGTDMDATEINKQEIRK
jgi:nucleotide-binding universal stress UspA family protein